MSELAKAAGVRPDTIRYYERAGLLPPPARTPAGHRSYDATAVDRLRFIRDAQRLGLRLRDIADLLAVRDTGTCPHEPPERLLRRRLAELDAEMARLAALRRQLVTMLGSLPGGGRPEPGAARPSPQELKRLRRARDLIDREYARPLDVPAMARAALMSPAHFSRQFRAAFGETPYAYLMTRRIERAMALLRRGDMSVTEVCFAVGCSSLGTFSTRFTELVGVPPSVYRAAAEGPTDGMPPCVAKQVTRPIRNREARALEPHLA